MKVTGNQYGQITNGKVIVNTPEGTCVDGKKVDAKDGQDKQDTQAK